MIVVDTNLLVYLLVEGEHTESVRSVLKRDDDWIAPSLWRHEFRNVMAVMVNRDRLTPGKAVAFVQEAESRMESRTFPVSSQQVLELSRRSGLSAYDCEFVSLALVMDVSLVTSDQTIPRTFPQIALTPRDFLEAQ